MILQGPNIENQMSQNQRKVRAALSISELLMFNSVNRSRASDIVNRHSTILSPYTYCEIAEAADRYVPPPRTCCVLLSSPPINNLCFLHAHMKNQTPELCFMCCTQLINALKIWRNEESQCKLEQLWLAFGTGKSYRSIPAHLIVSQLGQNKSRALPVIHA